MRKICLIIFISSFTGSTKAEIPTFIMGGRIPGYQLNAVSLVAFVPLAPGTSYSIDTVLIHSDSFVIYGRIQEPHLFYLSIKAGSLTRNSNLFFLDSGQHTIKVLLNDSLFCINDVSNSPVYKEYLNQFLPFLLESHNDNEAIGKDIQSIKSFYEDDYTFRDISDSTLFDYIRAHPKSFVGFWFLYRRFLFAYPQANRIYYQKFILLDRKIRKSSAGIELYKLLQNENSLSIGKKFPQFVLKDTSNKSATVNYMEDSLTLIDYWATWCAPCRREIPALQDIYNKYKSSGFNIISISVDQTKDFPRLKKIIDSLQMNWKHYWDENSLVATSYKILFFPTHFLLNNKGEIIASSHGLKPIIDIIEKKSNN